MQSPPAEDKSLFRMRARCRAAELVAPEALAQADPAASIYRALGLGGRGGSTELTVEVLPPYSDIGGT